MPFKYIYKIHVSTDFIFKWLNHTIVIYDSNGYNFLTKIETFNPIYSILTDQSQALNFLVQTEKSEILIYDTKSLTLIGTINSPFKLNMYLNENIIFSDLSGISFVNKLELQAKVSTSKYKCYLNTYQPHLFKNPYLLPCGNSACLDCIHENMNIYKNRFKCYDHVQVSNGNNNYINTCNEQQHGLFMLKIDKNTKLDEAIKENSEEILTEMLMDGVEIINKTGK